MSTLCPGKSLAVVFAVGLAAIIGLPLPTALAGEAPYYDDLAGTDDVSGAVRISALQTDFRLYHNEGQDSVGYQDDSTTFELFHPMWNDDFLWFLDGRYSLTNQAQSYGNVGLGVRKLNAGGNRFWGLNAWFDVDGRSEDNTFQQVGLGVESIGEVFDFRANGYLPIQNKRSINSTFVSDVFYQQYSLFYTQASEAQVAMDGFDAEVGVRIPIQDFELRTYAGFYAYDAKELDSIHGFRGRIEGYLFRDFGVNVIVQNDDVYDTTVVVSAVWTLPVSKCRDLCGGPQNLMYDRMLRSVQRSYQMYVADQLITEDINLIDATTGQPFTIIHVDSNAPAGGNGTFEDPFQLLSEAQVNSAGGNTIFAHADSIFNGESITLKPQQKFIGEGANAFVDTVQLGVIPLPRATDGTNLPIIQNSPGNSVTLAANTIVSSFQIIDPAQSAIFGDGYTGSTNVSAVSISGPGQHGIYLTDITGGVSLTNFSVSGAAGNGVFLEEIQGNALIGEANLSTSSTGLVLSEMTGNVSVTDSTLMNNVVAGISILNSSGNTLVTGSTLQQTGGTLINIQDAGGTIDFSGNTILSQAGTGVAIANSSANVSIDSAVITNTPAATNAIDLQNNIGTTTFTDLQVTTNGGTGLFADMAGTLVIDGTSQIAATGAEALNISNTTIDLTLANLSSTGSAVDGVFLDGVSGSLTVLGMTTVTGADNFGIAIQNSNGFAADFGDTDLSDIGVFGVHLGAGVFLSNNMSTTTVFDSLDIDTQFGTGIFSDSGGQLTAMGTNNVDAIGGPAVDLTNTIVGLNFVNLSSTDSTAEGLNFNAVTGPVTVSGTATVFNSANAGINIQNSTGAYTIANVDIETTGAEGITVNNSPATVTVSDGLIQDTTGDALNVSGSNPNVTYRGDILNDSGHLISVSNTTGGAVNVIGGSPNDNGGEGILLQNVGGNVTISAANVANSTGRGVDIQGGTGTITLNQLNISNAAAEAFNVNGGSVTANVNSPTITNSSDRLISVTNTTGGIINFNGGNLTDSGGEGILFQNAGGTFNLGTILTTIQNSSNTGVDVQSSSGNMNLANVNIFSPAGIAFNVNGGTANVSFNGQIFNSTNRIISITNTLGGSVNIDDGGASGQGIQDLGGNGVLISNAASTVNITDVLLQNTVGNGVDVLNGSGNYTLTNFAIQDPTGIPANVMGTSGLVTFNSPVINNTGSVAVSVTNTLGGGVQFVGGSIMDVNGQGLLVDNNAAFVSITNATIMDPTVDAVRATNNSQVIFGNLLVDTTNSQQRGFVATGNNFVQTFASTIITQDATAVVIDGDGIFTQMEVDFDEVTALAMGGAPFANGIFLDDVFGNFNTDAGMIMGATGDAILINNASQFNFGTISINGMDIEGSGGFGINASGVTNFQMTQNNITGAGGVLLQTENIAGNTTFVSVDDQNSVTADTGDAFNWTANGAGVTLATITGNDFSGAENGLEVLAADNTTVTVLIEGNSVEGMTPNAAMNLHVQNTAVMNATVVDNDMTSDTPNVFQALTDNAGTTMRLLLGDPSDPDDQGNDVTGDPLAAYLLSNSAGAVFSIGGDLSMGAMSIPQHINNNGNTSGGMSPPNVSVVGNINVIPFQTIPQPP